MHGKKMQRGSFPKSMERQVNVSRRSHNRKRLVLSQPWPIKCVTCSRVQ